MTHNQIVAAIAIARSNHPAAQDAYAAVENALSALLVASMAANPDQLEEEAAEAIAKQYGVDADIDVDKDDGVVVFWLVD